MSTFVRLAPVTVPTLKLPDGESVFVRITQPMLDKVTQEEVAVVNIDGTKGTNVTEKTIRVLSVVDLTDNKPKQLVAGAILASNLRDYKGGNMAYLGKCFEIYKGSVKPGGRAKLYEVYEIADPEPLPAAK
jgi:hypothetical protein